MPSSSRGTPWRLNGRSAAFMWTAQVFPPLCWTPRLGVTQTQRDSPRKTCRVCLSARSPTHVPPHAVYSATCRDLLLAQQSFGRFNSPQHPAESPAANPFGPRGDGARRGHVPQWPAGRVLCGLCFRTQARLTFFKRFVVSLAQKNFSSGQNGKDFF